MYPPKRTPLLKIPAFFYGLVVGVRNFAFDVGWLRSYKPEIPTICVGNLSVGGTGKTPHIELLIRLLHLDYRVAVVSRGYGRIGKEPILATPRHTASEIGDEPAQILRKYPEIVMYVDGDRVRAIKEMESWEPSKRPDVILMDDGFQHRYVKPAYSILLTPYHHPFTRDHLLPYGNLRESRSGKMRADTVIVTSTPRDLSPMDFRWIHTEFSLLAHQDLYFSRVVYDAPRPVFSGMEQYLMPSVDSPVVLLSGIANPMPFEDKAESLYPRVDQKFDFPDHHIFSKADLDPIIDYLIAKPDVRLVCTEKDAMRLQEHATRFPDGVKARLFALPISIDLSPESCRRILAKARQAVQNNGLELA